MPWASRAGEGALCLPGRQQYSVQRLKRGEDGVVQSLGEEKRVDTHPKGHYFWANACAGLNWNWVSTQFCPG